MNNWRIHIGRTLLLPILFLTTHVPLHSMLAAPSTHTFDPAHIEHITLTVNWQRDGTDEKEWQILMQNMFIIVEACHQSIDMAPDAGMSVSAYLDGACADHLDTDTLFEHACTAEKVTVVVHWQRTFDMNDADWATLIAQISALVDTNTASFPYTNADLDLRLA